METFKIGQQIIELESIDSTNNYLSKLNSTSNVANGTVILAHEQVKGKGQRGNTWHSNRLENLTFSFLFKPKAIAIDSNFHISMLVSNAIHKFLTSYGIQPTIKWPNDTLIGKNKIAGVLIENSIQKGNIHSSIIGIGLNVNQIRFPEGIEATSIRNELGQAHPIKDCLEGLLYHLQEEIDLYYSASITPIKNYYLQHLLGYQEPRTYVEVSTNRLFTGIIRGVKPNGLLEIEENEQLHLFAFKEIQWIK